MYELVIKESFASAHQLRGYKGKCENLHGHNWKVEIYVMSETLNEIGLVMDFLDIKKEARSLLQQLDHHFLNDVFPFTEINPSSENIAKWFYDGMSKRINTENVFVSRVTVWESDTAAATYFEE
ncbi:MAG: 6-carboxytetrahydropterin synthase QueD [Nitrospirae bacterium]|nr:6-carboxytetrahydropterin synthase QueD [Nitrospirota bacterium]